MCGRSGKDFSIGSDPRHYNGLLYIPVWRSSPIDSTTTGRPRVCILWRGGVSCPVSAAWHSCVAAHWSKYHCYKQAPSLLKSDVKSKTKDLKLVLWNSYPQLIQSVLITDIGVWTLKPDFAREWMKLHRLDPLPIQRYMWLTWHDIHRNQTRNSICWFMC